MEHEIQIDQAEYKINPADKNGVMLLSHISSLYNFSSVKLHHLYCSTRFLGNGLFNILDYNSWKPRRRVYDPAFKKGYDYYVIASFPWPVLQSVTCST